MKKSKSKKSKSKSRSINKSKRKKKRLATVLYCLSSRPDAFFVDSKERENEREREEKTNGGINFGYKIQN
jgi:hypothetical protein